MEGRLGALKAALLERDNDELRRRLSTMEMQNRALSATVNKYRSRYPLAIFHRWSLNRILARVRSWLRRRD